MKRTLLITAFSLIVGWTNAQTTNKMKLNAGIITEKLAETKEFYTNVLGFGVSFENDFFLLMHTPDQSAEISFFTYLTIEVADVDKIYEQLKNKNVSIEFEIRDEVWGDRHFAIVDPNGIGIDIVTHTKPE